jgi:hypothetical protein
MDCCRIFPLSHAKGQNTGSEFLTDFILRV